jgi:cytochrome P450
MPSSPVDLDLLADLRAKRREKGSVFWNDEDELAVFDPLLAQRVNALNFADLTLPDKLGDLVRGHTSEPVSWKQVRAAWAVQLHRLAAGEEVGKLAARMISLLDARLDRPLDLVWLAQEVSGQALVPVVMDGLSTTDLEHIVRDQNLKAIGLVTSVDRQSLKQKIQTTFIQLRTGAVIRRELRGRAAGRRPRRLDLTDPVVDLLPVLGIDRAVPAMVAMLTAIGGPPGAAAACLLFELTRHSDWYGRLAGELAPIPKEEFYAAPTRVAPLSYNFVRETLRLWSPPMLFARIARVDLDLETVCLKTGQRYLLSPHLTHRDPRYWKDPETFDPDRWLPGAEHGPCHAASYVPFGWAPKACIGAGMGTTLLMLLCHMMCTRYRLEVEEPQAVRMSLGAAPLPLNFRGTIVRRSRD